MMSTDGQPPWDRSDTAVRIRLLSTPGARQCPRCTVITQGGAWGAKAHDQACHKEER